VGLIQEAAQRTARNIMSNRKTCDVLICGAGGFIGGWLVAELRSVGGLSIRAVDI